MNPFYWLFLVLLILINEHKPATIGKIARALNVSVEALIEN